MYIVAMFILNIIDIPRRNTDKCFTQPVLNAIGIKNKTENSPFSLESLFIVCLSFFYLRVSINYKVYSSLIYWRLNFGSNGAVFLLLFTIERSRTLIF